MRKLLSGQQLYMSKHITSQLANDALDNPPDPKPKVTPSKICVVTLDSFGDLCQPEEFYISYGYLPPRVRYGAVIAYGNWQFNNPPAGMAAYYFKNEITTWYAKATPYYSIAELLTARLITCFPLGVYSYYGGHVGVIWPGGEGHIYRGGSRTGTGLIFDYKPHGVHHGGGYDSPAIDLTLTVREQDGVLVPEIQGDMTPDPNPYGGPGYGYEDVFTFVWGQNPFRAIYRRIYYDHDKNVLYSTTPP